MKLIWAIGIVLLSTGLVADGHQITLKLWDQCGGKGGNCAGYQCVDGPFANYTCPTNSSCLKQSQWYYQCLPTDGYTCIPVQGGIPGDAQQGTTTKPRFTLKPWDQCGGQGGNCGGFQCVDYTYPDYGCSDGWSCQRQNNWYHQCLPGSGSGTAAGALTLWAQCGGKGGDCSRYACLDGIYPGQSCPSGSNCYKLSEWYSQCRPTGSSFGSCEQVPLWGSCGGKSSPAGANTTASSQCCPAGSNCNYFNEWFWQCQPQGYVAPNGAGSTDKTVTVTVTMTLNGVPASAVNTGAMAAGMQSKMAAGLTSAGASSVTVTAIATPTSTTGRRLTATTGCTISFTIKIKGGATLSLTALSSLSKSTAEAALKDREFLKGLLRASIPDTILALLDLDKLLDEAIASISISVEEGDGPATAPEASPSPAGGSSPSPGVYVSPSPGPGGYYGRR